MSCNWMFQKNKEKGFNSCKSEKLMIRYKNEKLLICCSAIRGGRGLTDLGTQPRVAVKGSSGGLKKQLWPVDVI